jgi:hypothetical protein
MARAGSLVLFAMIGLNEGDAEVNPIFRFVMPVFVDCVTLV